MLEKARAGVGAIGTVSQVSQSLGGREVLFLLLAQPGQGWPIQ